MCPVHQMRNLLITYSSDACFSFIFGAFGKLPQVEPSEFTIKGVFVLVCLEIYFCQEIGQGYLGFIGSCYLFEVFRENVTIDSLTTQHDHPSKLFKSVLLSFLIGSIYFQAEQGIYGGYWIRQGSGRLLIAYPRMLRGGDMTLIQR